MQARELFLERHRGFREYPDVLLNGMTESQIRDAPHGALNSIAWLLWHMARCEDLGVNGLVADRDQVLEEGWLERLNVPHREMGTGMPRAEAIEVGQTIDIGQLVAYEKAVADRTEAVVLALDPPDWDGILDPEILERVLITDGGGGRQAATIVEAYRGHTRGWMLGHLALTHNFYHIGQAFTARALHGVKNPW